jgi:hypothetical protein
MERWCELFATDSGLLTIEWHLPHGPVETETFAPWPGWRMSMPNSLDSFQVTVKVQVI